ncbi:hypothetical protein ACNKHU_17540 [Shigella flexneri]
MTHVTKLMKKNFLTGEVPPSEIIHNGFDTVRCANGANVRATVSKQANNHDARDRIYGVSIAIGSRISMPWTSRITLPLSVTTP